MPGNLQPSLIVKRRKNTIPACQGCETAGRYVGSYNTAAALLIEAADIELIDGGGTNADFKTFNLEEAVRNGVEDEFYAFLDASNDLEIQTSLCLRNDGGYTIGYGENQKFICGNDDKAKE